MIDSSKFTSEFKDWYKSRPKKIQEMIKAYPPGKYMVKKDAPYTITSPGCLVELASWNESGQVLAVVTKPTNQANDEALLKSIEFGNGPKKAQGIACYIDPKWLELTELGPEFIKA